MESFNSVDHTVLPLSESVNYLCMPISGLRDAAANTPSLANIIDTNVQVWSASTGLGAVLLCG